MLPVILVCSILQPESGPMPIALPDELVRLLYITGVRCTVSGDMDSDQCRVYKILENSAVELSQPHYNSDLPDWCGPMNQEKLE